MWQIKRTSVRLGLWVSVTCWNTWLQEKGKCGKINIMDEGAWTMSDIESIVREVASSMAEFHMRQAFVAS